MDDVFKMILAGGVPQGAPDDDDDASTILPEAQIDRLREAAEFYHRPNPFKVGDLVMSRKGTTYRSPGSPCVVVEVRDHADFHFVDTPSSGSYGQRSDMRVLRIMGDSVVAFWVESYCFEPYSSAE